jgi:hypothetical protein
MRAFWRRPTGLLLALGVVLAHGYALCGLPGVWPLAPSRTGPISTVRWLQAPAALQGHTARGLGGGETGGLEPHEKAQSAELSQATVEPEPQPSGQQTGPQPGTEQGTNQGASQGTHAARQQGVAPQQAEPPGAQAAPAAGFAPLPAVAFALQVDAQGQLVYWRFAPEGEGQEALLSQAIQGLGRLSQLPGGAESPATEEGWRCGWVQIARPDPSLRPVQGIWRWVHSAQDCQNLLRQLPPPP